MHSDVVEALDEGSMTLLIILGLSATFNVIDHPILLKRLEFSFGIKENALTWVKWYLTNKTDKTSVNLGFRFGVLRRSALQPNNYCICGKLFGDIIKQHEI